MNNELMTQPEYNNGIQLGPEGISLPSPGEPDPEAKNFFWVCAGIAVAAVGIGLAVMFAGRK